MPTTVTCPLCQSTIIQYLGAFSARRLCRCEECDLVFVNPDYHLTTEQERQRYLLHRNSLEDQGYLNFLEQLISPFVARLERGSTVLDFGSGPKPVMAGLLQARGYVVKLYDPHFEPDKSVLLNEYDGVTCAETVEHFRFPFEDWQKMAKCVRPAGLLAVMTMMQTRETDFANWWYIQDPTHVSFYSNKTFTWIARQFNLELEIVTNRVVFFKKKAEPS